MKKGNLRNVGLGDLIVKMHEIYSRSPEVVGSNVPEEKKEDGRLYQSIRNEINLREKMIFWSLSGRETPLEVITPLLDYWEFRRYV